MYRAEPSEPHRASRRVAGLCFALTALAAPALAQYEEPPTGKPANHAVETPADRVKQLMPEFERRRDAINAELSRLAESPARGDDAWANEWVGEYSCGLTGVTTIISLAPRSGIVCIREGCYSTWEVNTGDIILADATGVSLKLADQPKPSPLQSLDSEMYFVRWGERRYLIARSKLEEFCNAYNAGALAKRDFWVYPLHRDDRDKKTPTTPPNIAAEFAGLLLTDPIDAGVVKVSDVSTKRLESGEIVMHGTITLDAGSADQVVRGLAFHLVNSKQPLSARVVRTEEHQCEARFVQTLTDRAKVDPPRTGAWMSTLDRGTSCDNVRAPFRMTP
ncbi:MAG: hypothetical protein KBF28_12295 [Gemmatimonadales bacterium]|nr:hypothetical protein [Gemmatimonadales bacterium]